MPILFSGVGPRHCIGRKALFSNVGGLHIEMTLWNTIGDFLEGSGWTPALCEAGVGSSGTADSFL